MSRWLERLFLIASFLLAFYLCLWPAFSHAEGLYSDGFDHRNCAVTLMPQRHNLAITIGPPAGGSDLKLRMDIAGLPVRKGEALQGALVGQGGTAPYVYSIAAGSLPTGISLNGSTGILSGTPTVVGRYVFLAEVQDAALGVFKCTLAIEVIPALEIVAGTPTVGEAQLDYAYQFEISGATGAVTYSLISGTLPAGFGFTSGGLLHSSAPITTATPSPVALIVRASDAGSGDYLDIHCTLDVRSHLTFSASWTFPVGVDISSPDHPHKAIISTGVGPYTFSNFIKPSWMTHTDVAYYLDPDLPAYLATSPQDYVRGSVTFSGIPPASTYTKATQSFNLTFVVTDAHGESILVTIPVTITNAHALQPQVATVDEGDSGPINWNFSTDFTVSNDGTTVDIGLAGGGSSLTGDGVTIDIDSAGIISAISAPKLTTARTIAMTGDVAWSVSFDGSGNVTAVGTLATVNSNVGTFGDATHVAQPTVNAKGLITAISNVLITGTAPGGAAGGDLSGTYPNPTVYQAHLTDQAVPTPPSSGTLILQSYNQQGFSVAHVYDTQGNAIELNRDILFIVRNTSGGTITKGQAVYLSGTTGTVGTVALAKADSASTMPCAAIAYETAANNAYFRVMKLGHIESINLSAYSNADTLYVSATTAGALVNTAPTTFPQSVALVINNGVGNGVLSVILEPNPYVNWNYTGYTAKTTPAAADLLLLADSAASNQLKKITYSNLTAAFAPISLTSAHIFVGNASNVATDVAVTGDVTITSSGVTAIGTAKVTDAMLANMGALSVKGRSANSSGVPADIAASAASDAVLRESGSTIGFGTIATAGIANNAVTLAKLATQADKTMLANISGGSAVPTASTPTAVIDNVFGSTRGMVLRREASAWAAYALGTTGQALISDGTDVKWGTVGGGSGGGYVNLGSATVSGSAVTSFSVSGLNLAAYRAFKIYYALKDATNTSIGIISLFYNSDTTTSDYNEQAITGNGATPTYARANDARMANLDPNRYNTGFFELENDINGRASALIFANRDNTAGIIWQSAMHVWSTNFANVTGITISSSITNQLAVGSTFTVYGINP